MEHEQVYQGRTIRIVTARVADGTWQYAAELPEYPGESLKGGHATTEAAALSAGLSAAVAAIDRSRARTGKP